MLNYFNQLIVFDQQDRQTNVDLTEDLKAIKDLKVTLGQKIKVEPRVLEIRFHRNASAETKYICKDSMKLSD